jgi:hypothetical protein
MRIRARAAMTALLVAAFAVPAMAVPAAAADGARAAGVIPAGGSLGDWAWAVVTTPDFSNYQPELAFAHAPGGSTTVTRTAKGSWTVAWTTSIPGTLPNGGDLQVSPLGTTPHQCWVQSWTATTSKIDAKVRCRDAAGPYADTPFIVMWVEHGSPYATFDGMQSGYAWMNLAGTTGTPNTGYQATSGGGTITSTRTDKGAYTVTMPGLEQAEHVVVTSWNTDASCRPTGWIAGVSALAVRVVCRQQDGDTSDERFTVFAGRDVSMGGPGNGWSAYAVVRKPKLASYRVAAADGFNNAATPIAVRRVAKGRWTVRFIDMVAGGAAIVTPLGGRATCQVGSLPRTGKDLKIGVRCFSSSGAPADNRFVVSWGK